MGNLISGFSSGRQRELVLWLMLFAVVMVSRAPNLILDPRLWFYEATGYLAYAWQNGALASLLFVSTNDASYLNLSANIPATIAANLVPLEDAPCVTTGWSFLIQLVPLALVLFGRSHIWTTYCSRLVVCLALVFGPPAINGEAWLNSGNSQVFCGIIGLVLLCEDTTEVSGFKRWLYLALLILCALSGPYTSFMVLAFILKAYLEDSKTSRFQAWIVAASVLVQSALHLWTRYAFPFSPSRFAANHWGIRTSVLFYSDVICTLFGYDLGPAIARWFGFFRVVNLKAESLQYMRLAGWSSLVGLSVVVWCLVRWRRSKYDLLLPTCFASLLIALFFLTHNASNRYMVVPGTALLLSLVAVAGNRRIGWGRAVCAMFLFLSIGFGVTWYWRDSPKRYSPLGRAPNRPSWTDEVETWTENMDYRLRIWPYPRRVAMRIPWLPKTGPVAPATYIDVKPFALIAKGEPVTKFVPVSGLPADFRLIIKMRSTQPSNRTVLRLIMEDHHGNMLNTEPIKGFRWHDDHWVERWSYSISLREGANFSDVGGLRMILESEAAMPHRVSVEKFSIEPSNIGALEPFLPSRPKDHQTFEFDRFGRAIQVAE